MIFALTALVGCNTDRAPDTTANRTTAGTNMNMTSTGANMNMTVGTASNVTVADIMSNPAAL